MSQTTKLAELLQENSNSQPVPQTVPQRIQDPSAQFAQLPSNPPVVQVTNQVPSGVGQGVSVPDGPVRKEFFGFAKDVDYKSAILVFAIILILSSGMFSSFVRPYVPGAVASDGKNTLVGSFIAAILGALVFLVVKLVGRF